MRTLCPSPRQTASCFVDPKTTSVVSVPAFVFSSRRRSSKTQPVNVTTIFDKKKKRGFQRNKREGRIHYAGGGPSPGKKQTVLGFGGLFFISFRELLRRVSRSVVAGSTHSLVKMHRRSRGALTRHPHDPSVSSPLPSRTTAVAGSHAAAETSGEVVSLNKQTLFFCGESSMAPLRPARSVEVRYEESRCGIQVTALCAPLYNICMLRVAAWRYSFLALYSNNRTTTCALRRSVSKRTV